MIKNNIDIHQLWKSYSDLKSESIRNKIFEEYLWLVNQIVHNIKLPDNNLVGKDDLINIGSIGLSDAIDKFDYNRDVKFETYASQRIKGAIKDELRNLDFLSRSARKKAQMLYQAREQLSKDLGREANDNELMTKLEVSESKFNEYIEAANIAKNSLSLSNSQKIIIDDEELDIIETIPDTDLETTLEKMIESEKKEQLTKYLKGLTEKKRLVISLYYFEELNFKEIGKLIDVSESRVCQIHTEVINDLKQRFYKYDNA